MKLTFKINKPSSFILDYLTDMQKFVSVHPLISKIDNLGNNNYLVYETLKMGFFPFSFTYPVTIESFPSDKLVTIRATVMRFTKIEMNFKVNSNNGYCVVEETIRFNSPLPVKPILQKIFKKQHGRLFENIEQLK